MIKLMAVDLFSGAGGLSLGLSQAGVEVVLANEIEPDFAATHEQNHPECEVVTEDIYKVDFDAALRRIKLRGAIDLLCGGPPCQGFSTVGKKELTDPRNSLFAQFLRAVDQISPRFVLFENVSGFKKLYGGVVFQTLTEELDQRGFSVASAVMNAMNFGLPQSRERTIVIGWRRGERPVALPAPTHGHADLITNLKPLMPLIDAISDLPSIPPGGVSDRYAAAPKNAFQASMRSGNPPLTEHNCANYGTKMREILELIPPGGSVLDLPKRLRPKSYFKNTYARLVPDAPSPTITRNFGTPSSSRCVHPFQNRALSTREGARLQGFPDSYAFSGAKGSKNLQIGNAVPPILGQVLANAFLDSLRK
jgi:DNA (cytosine-5)-methyltransferase 1